MLVQRNGQLLLALIMFSLTIVGCDRVYGVLHRPGGEEREILGDYTFNVYSPRVEELQQLLKLLGYNIGRADGRFGPGTREAVAKFQTDENLDVTRFVDKPTWERLKVYATSPFIQKGQINARSVQLSLKKAGFDPGKMDGQLGQKTRDAVKAFQRKNGLKSDGHIGLKTIKALWEYYPNASYGGAVVVELDRKSKATENSKKNFVIDWWKSIFKKAQ